jgi:hypothetical protein
MRTETVDLDTAVASCRSEAADAIERPWVIGKRAKREGPATESNLRNLVRVSHQVDLIYFVRVQTVCFPLKLFEV